MKDVLYALAFLLLGGCLGALILIRWWARQMNKPEVARNFLRDAYKIAHPHWLTKTEDDFTPVCPCCGWHPERAREPHEEVPS